MGLVSSDLLARSRVQAALGRPVSATGPGLPAADGGWALLLVDLNSDAAQRLAWLGRQGPQVANLVLCFGPHTELAELSQRARRSGAGRCVANSHLDRALASWVRAVAASRGER